jgi:hypothetical protein
MATDRYCLRRKWPADFTAQYRPFQLQSVPKVYHGKFFISRYDQGVVNALAIVTRVRAEE